ncbi:hypothetical protein QUF80_19545 [Desulfococcaceae bacterium HSG8]|nr:hypothetical protein [Desulfococcaceae bacterium HSG8]
MMKTQRFSYTPMPGFIGGMPFVDIQLSHNERSISASALTDSGSALNILPFDVGLELGFIWEKQTFPLDLRGTLRDSQAYAVLVRTELAPFPSLDLGFAWVSRPVADIRILLGQVNFFQEFNISFYGHHQVFDITPRSR